jgi:uncharacterized membrane protein YkvA (DUF1232 family)
VSDERLTLDLRDREKRVYDRLRARIAPPRPGASSGVRDLLLLLPDVAVFLLRLLRDDRVPVGAKAIAVAGVGYLLSPLDLLPDILLGPLGFVDDLLIAGAALASLVNRVHPDLVRHHWPGQGDALAAIRRITDWAEAQVTNGLWGMVRRVFAPRG